LRNRNQNYCMFAKLKLSLIHYSYVVFYLILSVSVIRLLEYTYLFFRQTEEISFGLFFGRSLTFDAFFILGASLVFLIPYLAISYLHQKAGKIFIGIIATLVIFSFLGLTQHFLTTDTVMTAMLFDFSMSEMTHTVSNELSLERLLFWAVYIVVLPFSIYTLFFRFRKIKSMSLKSKFLLNSYMILALIAGLNVRGYSKPLNQFDSKYQFLLGNCKATFLLESWMERKQSEALLDLNNEELVNKELTLWNKTRGQNLLDSEYPFLKATKLDNVLGDYFDKSDVKPNIVVIIAESLSSSFSGNNTPIGDLTPFTSSLMKKSLYWDNFYSNAQLSFGVMPNLLSSLPFGLTERGFVNTHLPYESGMRYPKHHSLVQLLNDNDYTTAYYYGGWGNYDHVGDFIKSCNIQQYTDEHSFITVPQGDDIERPEDNLMWGYDDKVLFQEGLHKMGQYPKSKPHFSIFQTLSLHSPYNMCSQDYYGSDYLNQKIKSLGLNKSDLNKIEPAALSSIFFADDALEEFFEEYEKRPDFKNTIFVITGDHAINKLYLTDHPLERYRVPLIIYSPLLKDSATFKGACSHIDVLPSLMALLDENFGLELPEESALVGSGLDMSKEYRSNKTIQLNLHSFQFPVFIHEEHFVYSHEVYRMDSYGKFELEADKAICKNVLDIYNSYKFINNYAIAKDRIIRD
jgi:phosphoglycerol transferase MdoB-like AlkP superfamily enzyme